MWHTLLEVWHTLIAREARTRPGLKTRELPAQPYNRTRCKSKCEKDKVRLDFRLERERLFQEAFHDTINSTEVNALTGSEAPRSVAAISSEIRNSEVPASRPNPQVESQGTPT